MSSQFVVRSVLGLSNALPKEKGLRYRQIKKPTDSKIKTFVLKRIVEVFGGRSGALFPLAAAPRVVIGLLSNIYLRKKQKEKGIKWISPKEVRPSSSIFCLVPSRRIPIGLKRSHAYPWLNSLFQFLLFLPGTWELFSLIPKSFEPLRKFVDQYVADREANLPICSADSADWIPSLIRKFPPQFFQNKTSIYDVLNIWMRSLFFDCPFMMRSEIHPVLLHPEWHLIADSLDLFQKKMYAKTPELLIGTKGGAFPWKTHYFAALDGVSYDLDAFIELRPDSEQGDHFIAYLKCDGTWYQCDDERIVPFRSRCLNTPLRRARLLHYKRVELDVNSKIYLKK